MAIQVIYKVPGLTNEFDSEQEAMVAEAIDQCEGLYIESHKMERLVKAITSKYFLVPILPTITIPVDEDGNEIPTEAQVLRALDQATGEQG